jgi:multimeric flavodoxin WrbA
MKFTIVDGTLKTQGGNTSRLCDMAVSEIESQGHDAVVIKLTDMDYTPGTEITANGVEDGMTAVIKQLLESDAILFATPIWWNNHSSLTQALVERLDGIDQWSITAHVYPFMGKTFGCLVSGAEDGVQHIWGNLDQFMNALGCTIPPMGNASTYAQGPDMLKDAQLRDDLARLVMNHVMMLEIMPDRRALLKLQAKYPHTTESRNGSS